MGLLPREAPSPPGQSACKLPALHRKAERNEAFEDVHAGRRPADRIDRLFKTFSQIDSSTTRHYGGSGLGLSIVKRLAELMGGEVGVHSEPGRGSTFWVTIKVDTVREELHREPVGLGRRVLIVDDVPVSCRSLARKLGLARFETVSVGGVDEAWEQLAKDSSFDLVLADELMPMKGGLDLLAADRA